MYSNLIAFLTSFILVVCAEMGDKTQLLVINFASKYKVHKVLIGIFIGALCSNIIAILIGSYINNIPTVQEAIKIIACLIFIFFAFFNAMEFMSDKDKKEEDKKMKIFSSGILTVALAIFIGEMGDKTNLSTVALTTQFENGYIYILLGATFAMVASNVLSIFIGSIIQNRLSPKGLSILSTMLFLVFGIIGLSAIINQYMQNAAVTIMFAITLFLICSIICKKIYSNSK